MATNVDEWEDIPSQGLDSEWEDVQPTETMLQKGVGMVQKAIPVANQLFQYTPPGLMLKGAEMAQKGFDVAGEKTAEYMGSKGIDPNISAGVGTGIQMVPDIATSILMPLSSSGPAVKSAVPMARRALGFQKSLLKTPFARGQATKAAETALEKGVIGYSGSPTSMLDKAQSLASTSGQRIGSILKETPASLSGAFKDLRALRPELTKGMKTGVYSGANKAIDDIQQNIVELSKTGSNLTAEGLNSIKARLGQSINYLADLASQSDNKAIQTTLANSIRNMVKNKLNPQEFVQYLQDQKFYNASKLMMKGLNNEIAGQMGNRVLSPYSAIAGAGQLASGNLPGAAATLGVTEGLMRRGMGTGAALVQDIGTNAPGLAITGARIGQKTLTKEKAKEFYDQAKRENPGLKGPELKQKAVDLAAQNGWSL